MGKRVIEEGGGLGTAEKAIRRWRLVLHGITQVIV
jgi:hypothetical protein